MSAPDIIPLALAFVSGVFGGLALAGLAAAWRVRRAERAFERHVWRIEAVGWDEAEGGVENNRTNRLTAIE